MSGTFVFTEIRDARHTISLPGVQVASWLTCAKDTCVRLRFYAQWRPVLMGQMVNSN